MCFAANNGKCNTRICIENKPVIYLMLVRKFVIKTSYYSVIIVIHMHQLPVQGSLLDAQETFIFNHCHQVLFKNSLRLESVIFNWVRTQYHYESDEPEQNLNIRNTSSIGVNSERRFHRRQ